MILYNRSTYDSPLGEITLITSASKIHLCEFSDKSERINKHLTKYYSNETILSGQTPAYIKSMLDIYFKGECALDFTLAKPKGTDFQRRIWAGLTTIPYGQTYSYQQLAAVTASHPRAVGMANGANPISLFIPCHRVIGKDGSLTGYAGGLDRKKALLELEAS